MNRTIISLALVIVLILPSLTYTPPEISALSVPPTAAFFKIFVKNSNTLTAKIYNDNFTLKNGTGIKLTSFSNNNTIVIALKSNATNGTSNTQTLDTMQNIGGGGISIYAGNTTKTNFQFKTITYGTGINGTNGTNLITVNPDLRYLQPQQLLKRSGAWTGEGSTTSDGILNGMFVQNMGNETTARTIDTNGLYFKRTTAAGINNQAGITSSTFTERLLNPDVFYKFRLDSLTDSRLFMGFNTGSATTLSGNDPCNAKSCFMFGIITNSTNFQIIKNDGVGVTVFVPSIAIDSNIHTIELKADNANSRFGWSVDGGAFTYETSDIPAASTNLSLLNELQTTKAVTKSFDTWFIQSTQDK